MRLCTARRVKIAFLSIYHIILLVRVFANPCSPTPHLLYIFFMILRWPYAIFIRLLLLSLLFVVICVSHGLNKQCAQRAKALINNTHKTTHTHTISAGKSAEQNNWQFLRISNFKFKFEFEFRFDCVQIYFNFLAPASSCTMFALHCKYF